MSRRPHLLSVIVHDLELDPSLTALCAGFESGQWRMAELAREIIYAIPDFALTHTSAQRPVGEAGMEMLAKAVHSVYATEKYEKRGEYGEVLLHIVMRQVFGTIPAIRKIYFQDDENHVVKGYDAVHVVAADDGLELWLGEVKFYDNLSTAISHVRAELHQHTASTYLRSEFAAISSKVEDDWPHAETLRRLTHQNTSLDDIFVNLTIPVLLTYDSRAVSERVSQTALDAEQRALIAAEYKAALEREVRGGHQTFSENLPADVQIRLILVPLHEKKVLQAELHARLTALKRGTA